MKNYEWIILKKLNSLSFLDAEKWDLNFLQFLKISHACYFNSKKFRNQKVNKACIVSREKRPTAIAATFCVLQRKSFEFWAVRPTCMRRKAVFGIFFGREGILPANFTSDILYVVSRGYIWPFDGPKYAPLSYVIGDKLEFIIKSFFFEVYIFFRKSWNIKQTSRNVKEWMLRWRYQRNINFV